ncbi:hypothetical protein FTX61_18675 [Nitriliruptoraceae bacterium ZYF776]|nr:hypothetical protein [Profundirhabdus halotolerans]
MRTRCVALVATTLLLAACASDGTVALDEPPQPRSEPPHRDDVDRVHVHGEPWCAPAPVADVVESGLSDDAAAEARAWRTDGGPGAGYGDIDAYVDEHPELILGAYIDDDAETHVVVVDPARSDRLDDVADALEERTATLPIRVEPGCNELEDLERARDGIRNGDAAPMPDGPFTMELDPARSRVVIRLPDDPGSRGFVAAIQDAYGDLVQVELEGFMVSDDAGAAPAGRGSSSGTAGGHVA